MNPKNVYLVDENDEQRRAFLRVLRELFDGAGVKIEALAPYPNLVDYAPLLAIDETAAFILDQKLEDGGISYSGIELASYLSSVKPKLPLYILTNYAGERALFEGEEANVEYIISKEAIGDPTSHDAQVFKARFLRRLGVLANVLGEQGQRYHELLVKSIKSPLTADEQQEMAAVEGERLSGVAAAELERQRELDQAIEKLKDLLADEEPK